MPRSLVIGGTLFIGRALVDQLLARGDDVVIMHRGTDTPFGSRVGEIQCDRNDVAAVTAALEGARFDFIYDNVFDWSRGTTAEQVSAAATANVKGLRRYVFTSSVAAYEPGAGERDEDAALARSDNENGYGVKKAESESALFALWRERGVPVSTVRPAFVYGPNNPFDREFFFFDRLLAGRPILVPDDGHPSSHPNGTRRSAGRTTSRTIRRSRRPTLCACSRKSRERLRTSCRPRAND
jgi:2'-hydroxyisoflavone reductase